MRISHEVPLDLLNTSQVFNDFDYALVHLFDDFPGYFQYYKDAVENGRMVYLDNSLYELGESFDPARYIKWINELRPTAYIIPDTFWDSDKTIRQAMDWFLNWKPQVHVGCKTIGVAQGATYEDIVKSYKFMACMCDVVAFTFKFHPDFVVNSSKEFQNFFLSISNSMVSLHGMSDIDLDDDDIRAACSQAMIRYAVIGKLSEDGIIDTNKKHHLLGCQNTFLLNKLAELPYIFSIDTSNPIITALEGRTYDADNNGSVNCNLCSKPRSVLGDYFKNPISIKAVERIKYNTLAFREICGTPVNKLPIPENE